MKTYPYNEPVREKLFGITQYFINELNAWIEEENIKGNLINIIGYGSTGVIHRVLYTSKKVVEEEEESQDITVDGNSNKMSNLYCTCGQQPCDCPF